MKYQSVKPTIEEEKRLWQQGYEYVIGIDEVGRGSFAGPVVSASVIFPKNCFELIANDSTLSELLQTINDSKLVSPMLRAKLAPLIKKYCLTYSIGISSVSVINRFGIGKATAIAMRRSIGTLLHCYIAKIVKNNNETIEQFYNCFLLVDGFHIKYVRGIGLKHQKAIVKGDQKSVSIAAASILAKVHRDALMRKLDKEYPVYGFSKNKGYGTAEHQLAIKKYGLSVLHRTSFDLAQFLT